MKNQEITDEQSIHWCAKKIYLCTKKTSCKKNTPVAKNLTLKKVTHII